MANLIVLGTSNCVLKKGFLDGLRDNSENNFAIKNLSAGASSSLFALWSILHFEEKLFDNSMFLIDTIVNDEHFESKNSIKKYVLDMCYSSLGISLRNSNSFGLHFSSRSFFDTGSLISKCQEYIFSSFGIDTISLRRILKKSLSIANEKENFCRDASNLFEDGGHFHRHLSYQIGRDLPFKTLFDRSITYRNSQATLKKLGYYEYKPNDVSPTTRSTSLRSEQCYIYKIASEIFLSDVEVLYGLAIDASFTRCILRIIYNFNGVSRTKEYAAIYSSSRNKLQVKFIHFHEPLICDPGSLRIFVASKVVDPDKLQYFIHSDSALVNLSGLALIGALCSSSDIRDNINLNNNTNHLSDFCESKQFRCSEIERNMIRKGKYFNAINFPPEMPHYPASFIEI